MLRGEREFQVRRVNNPQTDQAMTRLKYIGPYFSGRFANNQQPIQTFDDLIAYIRTHTRERNTNLFKRVFRNQRYVVGPANVARCIGAVAQSRRPPHRYMISQYNRFAWNSTVVYLRRNMLDDERYTGRAGHRSDRIPALLLPRTLIQAYPNYC